MPTPCVEATAEGLPTAHSSSCADETTASIEEAASLDFEPWAHSDDEFAPPTNQEWSEFGREYLPVLRVAWIVMYRTKPEIVQMFVDEGEAMMALADDTNNLVEQFRNMGRIADLLSSAHTRMLIAGAVAALQEPTADDGGAQAKECAECAYGGNGGA